MVGLNEVARYAWWACQSIVVHEIIIKFHDHYNSTPHTAITVYCDTSYTSTMCTLGGLSLLTIQLIYAFLANVNSRSRSLYAIARPSVVCLSFVCNVRAPYSGGSNFRQYFYGIRYLGHPLTSTENFMEIVLGEPLRRGS